MKPVSKKTVFLIGIICSSVFWIYGYSIIERYTSREVAKEVIQDTIICMEDSFTVKDFVLELHLQKIKHPDIVLRQACLESAFFSSYLWRRNNNPFGFRYKEEYLLFNDWRSSIAYMKQWQDKYYKEGNYYDFLERRGYAEDTLYTEKLKCLDISDLRNLK